MTHDELVANLGTIAHSGSGEFLKALASAKSEQEKSEISLIGQFGVGFYAAFMIADRVRVRTRGYNEDSGWEWESEGTGTFTITPVDDKLPRGSEVVLHLKDDAKDFTSPWRIKEIVRRYSSFVPFPIRLGADGEESSTTRNRSGLSPRARSPMSSTRDFTSTSPTTPRKSRSGICTWRPTRRSSSARSSIARRRTLRSLGFARLEHRLNLCAQACARAKRQQGPRAGIPPIPSRARRRSEDLPLNVSRETLQDNSVIRKIRASLVKGVLDRLDHLAQDDADKFHAFYDQFGKGSAQGGAGGRSGQQRTDREAASLSVISERRYEHTRIVR